MAKKKGQEPKTFPKVGQRWVEKSGEIPHELIIIGKSTDSDRKETWECDDDYTDAEGNKMETTRTLYLADFSESFMQCVHDPEEAAKPDAPTFEPSIVFSSKGAHMRCPSDHCHHILPMENTVTKTELLALFTSFDDLHRPHYLKGTVWDPSNKQ